MQTKSAVILFLFMVVLIVVNALLIRDPHWSFVEGVYFWFVTFTTVGFGDYVLWQQDRIKELSLNSSENQESKNRSSDEVQTSFKDLLKGFYLIIALCIVSSVLNAIMAAMEERRCHPRCPRCISRKKKRTDPQDHEGKEQSHIREERELNVEYSSAKDFGFKNDGINNTSL